MKTLGFVLALVAGLSMNDEMVNWQGPAMLAVAAGAEPRYTIGYRSDAALGAAADHVNAYVEIEFEVRRRGARSTRCLTIERSMPIRRADGGYRSAPMSMRELLDLDPSTFDLEPVSVRSIALAFFVGGRWDSNMGANYRFAL